MGINGLMVYLREKHPSVFLKSALACKGVAYVDTPLLTMSCGMVGMSSDATLDPYALLVGKLQQTIYLLQQTGVKEIRFVFDGPTRPEKIDTCVVRQQTIQKAATKRKREPQVQFVTTSQVGFPEEVDISQASQEETHGETQETPLAASPKEGTPEYEIFQHASYDHQLESDLYVASMIACGKDVGVLKDLGRFAKSFLQSKGVQTLQAPHDSESYIAQLMTPDDLAYTCDSDALPFGCSVIVQYLGTPKETWIRLGDVLRALNMDLLTFRKFCVMLGSDFNPRLPKCGPAKVKQCITSFSTFEKYCTENAPRTMTEQEKQKWISLAEKSLQVFCSG
jgi:hypothetical protein